MGPLIIDVAGYELDAIEREKLQHPLVGGLILFSRNYYDLEQLRSLTKDIRKTVNKPFLICVDHEGGRVQRFTKDFTKIPAMSFIQSLESQSSRTSMAWSMGNVMASELLLCDIDLSFAPVLDLDRGSEVIGERAFSDNPNSAIEYASAYIQGMNAAGMKATGKHFPGHGSVVADSHTSMPVDTRSFAQIEALDMSVFSALIASNLIHGIMPAHVIYNQLDDKPAGFSELWLQDVLRQKLGFNGVIFSDDLSMQAATAISDVVDRSTTAIEAGCDMILVCNSPSEAEKVLDGLSMSLQSHAKRANTLLITPQVRSNLRSADFASALADGQRMIKDAYR